MTEVLKIQYNEDDRAQRLLNVFDEIPGQINVSTVNSTNHIVAWHAHKIQTDYWTCVKGAFKVGLAYPINDSEGNTEGHRVVWKYLSDRQPMSIKIPPGVYHGYKALIPGSIMLYYLTEKYDPSDEFKAVPGDFGEKWDTENK